MMEGFEARNVPSAANAERRGDIGNAGVKFTP
jgi:hypothetical protein